jgi:hypothetical protein
MTHRQKLLIKFVAAIVTFGILYELVAIFIYNDFLISLVPGWHTTIYRLNTPLRITILIGICSIITFVLFELMRLALTYIWENYSK